ncbi:uncharacterized protein SEPMUDRAFT_18798, partial [Sphaerulina musiva SO2202]
YWIDDHWVWHEGMLGFPHITGRHTGDHLAEILFEILQEFEIECRLTAITCDNASNNKTLHNAIPDSEIGEDEEEAIAEHDRASRPERFPCFAHTAQLPLKAFFDRLGLCPTNDLSEYWDHEKDRQILQRRRKQSKQISRPQADSMPYLLLKIRKLCVFINSSSQRFEQFIHLQKEMLQKKEPFAKHRRWNGVQDRILRVVQDVKTRWSSTTLMLDRFSRLQRVIESY